MTIQEEYLKKVVKRAKKIRDNLLPILNAHEKYRGKVHFRPSSGGIAMIGLENDRPQRGTRINLKQLKNHFESYYNSHCSVCPQGRITREKALQSFFIREAYQNHRKMRSINEASRITNDPVDLLFVVDEISVPLEDKGRIVCDILAIRVVPDRKYTPVLLELKSSRLKQELFDQVEKYAAVVDNNSKVFQELFSEILGGEIKVVGSCEKWIVWPMEKDAADRRQEEFASKGIRVVGYQQSEKDFFFRAGPGVSGNTRVR